MSAEIKSFIVNEHAYKVQMLPVLDTIDLHIEMVSSCGGFLSQAIALVLKYRQNGKIENGEIAEVFKGLKPESLKPIKKKVFAQVITSENQFLSDEVEIERWFSQKENRADVWEVLVKATGELLGEYMPSFLKELTTGMLEKAKAEQLAYQNSSEPKA